MARERPWPYRIALAFLAKLQEIGHDETAWLTKPKLVALGTESLLRNAPRPAIVIDLAGPREEMLSGLDQHGESCALEMTMIAEDSKDPLGALHDLIADVRRCVRQNEALQVDGVQVTLRDIGWGRVQVQGEAVAGLGAAVVVARAFYESDEENP